MTEVRIPAAELTRFNNDVHWGTYVLGKLRDAGIPVTGVLFPLSIESGTLTTYRDDLAVDEFVWQWSP